ncbi:MAG: ComEC/Rec2 family competence protein [Bacteroidia bacterium]|nr:ComEC/Rec2 family competence protein [Bacteroidia bacterium]
MSDFVSKIPFLRLLLPAVTAIVVSSFLVEIPYPWLICTVGAGAMALSFFVTENRQFIFRWLFGIGLFAFVFGLFAVLYQYKKAESDFPFTNKPIACVGTVVDIPQEKPRSFACNVETGYPISKKIVVYLQKEDKARVINPGDEIFFVAQIQPFKNFGNPDDFDYARFMRNKGFSGSAYLPSTSWHATGKENKSLYILAQKFRKTALEFYRLFELDNDAYSFISALTLGYKHDLTNELQEAFRASGTSHVLAVSGLHVAIIYAIFTFLFSFLGKTGRRFVLKQILIIVALWFYAFLAGLSPSVLRATIMLTIASIGFAGGRKGFTYNTLAAAAFFILIYNPMSLFDVGFQMSFTAVFAILYFNPMINNLYQPKQKIKKYTWNLFTVSTSAQLGVFPIALYYFGTFPTYFFIANMLVVPMIGLIIYACIPMIAVVLLKQFDFVVFDWLFQIFGWVFKVLINFVLKVVYFIEAVPYAQLSDKYISGFQMILLLIIVITAFKFFNRKRASQLITVLTCSLLFVSTFMYAELSRKPAQIAVFNKSNFSDIGLFVNKKRVYFDIKENGFIPHSSKSVLRLSENIYSWVETDNPLEVDVLILSQDRNFSIEQLTKVFQPKQIVVDSSIPQYARTKLIRECEKLGISAHDVVRNGAFLINF